jgi:hypothetical protein
MPLFIKTQLVLQFKESDLGYEEMIALADMLNSQIGNLGEVDGHDVGSGVRDQYLHSHRSAGRMLSESEARDRSGWRL